MKKWLTRAMVAFISVLVTTVFIAVLFYAWVSSDSNGEIASSGETRKYLLYVPESYDPSAPTPLVISLHGAFLWPKSQMRFSEWNELADEEGFIVVYPKAYGFPAVWRMEPGDGLATEVRFFSDLIAELARTYNIDPDKVFVNGYSNGAAMTIMLACTMTDRIAAFGMVATPTVPWDWCQDPRPASVIVFNGTEDPFVPYEGGENFLTIEPLLGMQEWIALWGGKNLCSSGPVDIKPAIDVAVKQYSGCARGTAALLYSIEGAGHIWPGGLQFPNDFAGRYSDSIDATKEMWLFFQNHPLAPDSE